MGRIKDLERQFSQGGMSRREFITRMTILGATATVSPALLCSSAQASGPKKGGMLRIGSATGHTTNTLDPATLSDTFANLINFQISNTLVEIDHGGNATPELAESWEPSADARTWAFRLRKGVEFSNGRSLKPQDVIASINHHRGKGSKSGAKVLVESITDMKADGENTVIFTLDVGNADFPYILSDYHLTIFPAGTEDVAKRIGTGGYAIVEFQPGVRALTKRNPNYWKAGKAHFDEVETLSIGDDTARMTALRTGRVDLIDRVDVKTAGLIKRLKGIELVVTKGSKFYDFPMLTDTKPFDNLDVRLAMKYAVDRKDMVRRVLGGYGTVGNDQPVASILKYYDPSLPQRQYDPDKARFHMKKAGMLGETFNLSAADTAFPGAIDAAVLYQEYASKAGIKIDVVRESRDGYWGNVWMKRRWCAGSWGSRPTCDMIFTVAFAENAAWNHTHWKNKRFNELLLAARAELDEAKRGAMYSEMQRLVRDDGGTVIPMFANFIMATSTKLDHGPVAGNWELDGVRAPERWWFK